MRVIEFSKAECPFLNRDNTWQQFHTFRNGVVEVLSSYGTVGPTGKMPILDTYEESWDELQAGSSGADFFVVDDDMYGMSVRVEADHALVKSALLDELQMMLMYPQFEGWCVYLALVKGGLWVFRDRMLHEGDFFSGCASVQDLYQRCAGESFR
jgi:hypothetical protein